MTTGSSNDDAGMFYITTTTERGRWAFHSLMGRGVGGAVNCKVSVISCHRNVVSHSSVIIKKAAEYASICNSPITSRGEDVVGVGYPVATK